VETAKVRWPKRGNEFDAYMRQKIHGFMPLEVLLARTGLTDQLQLV
jgi:hypothetical protein